MAAGCDPVLPIPITCHPTPRSTPAYRTNIFFRDGPSRPRCGSMSSTCSTRSTRSGMCPALAYSLRNLGHAAGSLSAFRRSCERGRGLAKLSRQAPVRADRAGNVGERAIDEFGHQKEAVVPRTRHGCPSFRNDLEADAAVIGLVADQQHEAMAFYFRLLQRAIQQRAADAAAAKRRLARPR